MIGSTSSIHSLKAFAGSCLILRGLFCGSTAEDFGWASDAGTRTSRAMKIEMRIVICVDMATQLLFEWVGLSSEFNL